MERRQQAIIPFLILILLLAMLIPLGLFDGPDKPGPSSDIIRGCTDSTAQNHDANATEDDGSCTYAVVVIEGCMNSAATNYEPTASSDDGSCVYPPPSVLGCTDPAASNYDTNATVDDGSCVYPPPSVLGCTDPAASNYDTNATVDDGTCVYPPPLVPGCTDPAASNYDTNATVDDGSCVYPPPLVPGCTDPAASNYDANATVDDGSCIYPPPPLPNEREYTLERATGESRVLIILTNDPGATTPKTAAEALAEFSIVDDWFVNQSFGKIWFNTSVAGPYEIASSPQSQNHLNGLDAAIQDGFNLSEFDQIIFRNTLTNAWASKGMVWKNMTMPNGSSLSILTGRVQMGIVNGPLTPAYIHEFGHALGIDHSGFHNLHEGVLEEYGSGQSALGGGLGMGSLNAADKAMLGWINSSNIYDASSGGTWTITHIDDSDAETIRIPMLNGENWWLTNRGGKVEIVHTYPFDNQPGMTGGIGTVAFDASPETQTIMGGFDSNLHVGRSWTDPSGTIHLTLVSTVGNTVTVEVNIGEFPSNTAPTVLNVSATLVSTAPHVYDFSVTTNDVDGDDLSIFWNFKTNGGNTHKSNRIGHGFQDTMSWNDPPDRRVFVIVSDRHGGISHGWVDLGSHTNVAPTLSDIMPSDAYVLSVLGIKFASNASDSDPHYYSWDFGDGNTSNGREAFHNYSAEGEYLITLTVFDGEFSATHTEWMNTTWPTQFTNIAPIAVAGLNQTVAYGTTVQLNASGSYDPDEGPGAFRFNWSCDQCGATIEYNVEDGWRMTNATGLAVGTWEFTLEISDSRDITTATVWITVV